MAGYAIDITCPLCGSEVETRNVGLPTDGGRRTTTIVECTKRSCRRRWQVVVDVMGTRRFADQDLPS